MALSKVNFNSMNVTPAASKAIKFNSSNNGLETGDIGGSLVLISTQTASSSSTISFTSGIDSTYKEYIFKFIDIHPSANAYTQFQGTTDGSNFNTTITTTSFASYHPEADNFAILEYRAAEDLAQSTSFKGINGADQVGTDNDNCMVGTLHLFEPSSTTFVKHFIARTQSISNSGISIDYYTAGYFNTTSAITGIQFKNGSGNIDAGTIKMYGVT